MKRLVCTLLAVLFLAEATAYAGVGSKNTIYVGGTITSIKADSEGKSSTADDKVFVFEHKKDKLNIPYSKINGLEYGQKAGRRVAMAILLSPIALFSKKRKHFLTVNFMDEADKQQAAVFELGKDVVRVTLASLEARSGQKIEYQDEEARKSSKGN
ncbi:MAG TPA: hypothetical protein VNO24_07015 [Blastocatellia bacterium]|nr:hypothetical protein [Blastocatellia bacterium]